jgi:hypothetical protein
VRVDEEGMRHMDFAKIHDTRPAENFELPRAPRPAVQELATR